MGILAKSLGLEALADVPLGDYSANVQPPTRRGGAAATVDRALTLPAVYRAIVLTAGMAAQLEVGAKRRDSWIETPSLLAQPDPWRTLDSWIERCVVGLATDGNGFIRKHRFRSDDRIASAEVLNPFQVYIDRDRRGRKVYLYGAETLPADEVIHLWGLEVPGLNRGLGPIGHCRASLTGALDVRDYAADWFRSDDVPSGVLSTDQRLDPVAAAEYKRRWLNLPELDANGLPIDGTGKDRLGPNVRVLGQGLKYTPIMLKPEEAQWLEAQRFSVLDVARMYGLPADYLLAAVEGTSLTYANLEMIDAQFLRTTLFPLYLRKIEGALTQLLPRGQRARFKTAELLRPDAKTRAEIDGVYIDKGVYDGEYVRRREGIEGPAPERKETAA